MQISYRLEAVDSIGIEESWFVVQNSGFPCESVPRSVKTAIKHGNLKMLPIGGVAVRIPKPKRVNFAVATELSTRSLLQNGRPFCFLPLPGYNGLPMHTNGHFILQHEVRRGLWRRGNEEEFKADWNESVLFDLISVAYVEVLEFFKENVLFIDKFANYSRYDVFEKLQALDDYFPIKKDASDENWKLLSEKVLRVIKEKEVHLFPVVLIGSGHEESKKYLVRWEALHQKGHSFPVYVTSNEINNSIDDKLESLLRSLGMNVASVSRELQQSFIDSKISLSPMDPDSVLRFVKSYGSFEDDKVKVDKIPNAVQDTLYVTIKNVARVLRLCGKSDSFGQAVNGLPLLVTNDEMLRCFSIEKPVYCTTYAELFPKSAECFVNPKQIATIKTIGMEKMKYVTKELHVGDVHDLLCTELDTQAYTIDVKTTWTPTNFMYPNESWVSTLWSFFETDFKPLEEESHVKTYMEFLQPLQNWCLLPAIVGESSHILVKISKHYSVLALETFSSLPHVKNALQKLEVPCLFEQVLSEHSLKLITSFLGRAENPESVLVCLNNYKEEMKGRPLELDDCSSILGYFSDNLKAMLGGNAEKCWIAESLISLPLFVTKDGNRICFQSRAEKVLVIPDGIPEEGLEQWANATGTVLLRNEPTLVELYTFLGFTHTECIDVYLNHILTAWDSIPDTAVLLHLKYIKDTILSCFAESFSPKQKQVIEILQQLPLLPDLYGRRKVSDYFSPHHSVFKAMCRKDEFPADSFHGDDWKRFLEIVGLKHVVSGDMFIQFARTIAAHSRNGITDEQAEKSKVLVRHLFTHNDEWEPYCYQEISRIKFVIPHAVESEYTVVHKQYSSPNFFICSNNSISREHYELVWTSLSLLDRTADPDKYYKQGKKKNMLRVHARPTLESVITHTQNICEALKTHLEDARNVPSELSWVERLMEKLYDFLQQYGLSNIVTKQRLCNTPTVYIPGTNLFVPAHQIVQEMTSDQEISPYLLKAPIRYGKFFTLFGFLGAAEYPSFVHYMKVLAIIKHEVKENKLTKKYLGEWGAIRTAIDNLFTLLPETSQMVERETPEGLILYLPNRDWYMKDTSTLTVADNQYFMQRMRNTDSLQFLIDLKSVKLYYDFKYFGWLPRSVRPKFLSNIVKENVDMSQMVECQICPAGLKLERFIHSEHFIGAMLRLLKHHKTARQLEFSKKEEERVASKIQNTRVSQVSGLKTYLTLNGIKVEDTDEPKESFVSKSSDSETNIRIYFQTTIESELDLIHSIDDSMMIYTHNILTLNIPENLLMKVFRKINDPAGISLMLDRIQIDPYLMSGDVLASIFPDPGTYVPEELHHLLNCDFSEIKRHEYFSVALELEDDEVLDNSDILDSYIPVYIYVRIERKVQEDNTSTVTQKYEVFTGSETVVVPAFKIYKFVRPAEETSTDVVDAGAMSLPSSGNARTQIFNSICNALQEAWELPKEDRRHVIKRLYLRWHPDKNIGNEKFCEEVFKYIQEIIYKLDHGIPLDDDDTDDDYASPEYSNLFKRMNRRGHRDRGRAKPFYAPGPTGYGSPHRDFCEQPFKDLAEARRWQRQALVDLRNARDTIDTPGDPSAYNWICYMCHQVCKINKIIVLQSAVRTDTHTTGLRT